MKTQLTREKEKKRAALAKKKEDMAQKAPYHAQKQMPISWKHSEAIYHMYGENTLAVKERTTGLNDREHKVDSKENMREVFRAENAYGNIAIGANKKKEAAVVVSQKREHNEKTTQEHEKNLNMARKKRKVLPRGEVFTNNSKEKEGALVYQVNTKVPEQRVISEIKEYHKREESRMLEKRMPFLLLEQNKKQMVHLREQLRESYEKGDKVSADLLQWKKTNLQYEIQQKEQKEKTMQKKIKFVWEKARKAAADDFEMLKRSRHPEIKETVGEEAEDKPEETSDSKRNLPD